MKKAGPNPDKITKWLLVWDPKNGGQSWYTKMVFMNLFSPLLLKIFDGNRRGKIKL